MTNLEDLKTYILNNKVDEIFSSLEEMTNDQTISMVEFADTNKINIKFIQLIIDFSFNSMGNNRNKCQNDVL